MMARPAAIAGVVFFALATAWPAQAAFSGANGKIATAELGDASVDIRTINPDGTGETVITAGDGMQDYNPAWSPDGARIAIDSTSGGNSDIYLIDTGGANRQRLTTDPSSDRNPAWSPDGSQIVFESTRTGNRELWVMNSDGTGQTQLTSNPAGDADPAWSPDGTKIAFASNRESFCPPGNPSCVPKPKFQIFTIDADGSDATRITRTAARYCSDGAEHITPEWSPSGAEIAYIAYENDVCDEGFKIEYWAVGPGGTRLLWPPTLEGVVTEGIGWSPDGSNIAFTISWDLFTFTGSLGTPGYHGQPNWQPIPINAYPRPRGASPTYLSLVPAYTPCTTPNTQHGAPLSSGSCTPATQASGTLTLGTPDVNQRSANSVGSAILTTRADNLGTPADESDVKLRVNVTDVRRTSDLADYADQLEARPVLRITDRDNTPSPGGPGAATTVELPFPYAVPCTPTSAASVGSTCATTTTAEAVVPGSLTGGDRAVWELRRFDVYDADGARFLTQGLFVP